MNKKQLKELIDLLGSLSDQAEQKKNHHTGDNPSTIETRGCFAGNEYAFYVVRQYLLGNKGLLRSTYKPFIVD